MGCQPPVAERHHHRFRRGMVDVSDDGRWGRFDADAGRLAAHRFQHRACLSWHGRGGFGCTLDNDHCDALGRSLGYRPVSLFAHCVRVDLSLLCFRRMAGRFDMGWRGIDRWVGRLHFSARAPLGQNLIDFKVLKSEAANCV